MAIKEIVKFVGPTARRVIIKVEVPDPPKKKKAAAKKKKDK